MTEGDDVAAADVVDGTDNSRDGGAAYPLHRRKQESPPGTLGAILVFVGEKTLLANIYKIPTAAALGVVAGILSFPVAFSLPFAVSGWRGPGAGFRPSPWAFLPVYVAAGAGERRAR